MSSYLQWYDLNEKKEQTLYASLDISEIVRMRPLRMYKVKRKYISQLRTEQQLTFISNIICT
jgi:hypothetical protein